MKSIVLVTSNKGKAEEIQKILENFKIKMIWKVLDVPEIRSDSIEEISLQKAQRAFKVVKKPLIMEDTGIFFQSYKNFPGPYTRYFFESVGYDGIFNILSGRDRSAYFKTVVTYVKSPKTSEQFIGMCNGKISENLFEPIDLKLPFDAVFTPDGESRTFSRMSKDEKAKYSHRAKAVESFAQFFMSK